MVLAPASSATPLLMFSVPAAIGSRPVREKAMDTACASHDGAEVLDERPKLRGFRAPPLRGHPVQSPLSASADFPHGHRPSSP